MRESIMVKEWQAEARKEARLETTRAHLLRALEIRFGGEVPVDVRQKVEAQANLAALDRWFDQALTAGTIDVFRAALARKHSRNGTTRE